MKNKFILENLENNEIKEYKTLRDISNELKIDLKNIVLDLKSFFIINIKI
jgi:hypothetical protein